MDKQTKIKLHNAIYELIYAQMSDIPSAEDDDFVYDRKIKRLRERLQDIDSLLSQESELESKRLGSGCDVKTVS